MREARKPPPGGFFLPDYVSRGWRHSTQWLLISTTIRGVRRHEFEIVQRQRGAYTA
jgi:hypothetical protein